MNAARPPIWVVLRAHFVAQPRKSAALAVLCLVMMVVYARLFLKSGGPTSAEAAAAGLIPASGAGAPPLPPPKRFQPDRPLRRALERDPFEVRLDRFAVDPSVTAEPRPPEVAATQPVRAAGDLLLQGTLSGADRIAWINGRCVAEGEEIDGYRVEQVEPNRVVLSRDGLKRVLTMD